MYGFDLDGVISPDIVWPGSVDALLLARDLVCPLFVPSMPFCICTARPPCDEETTMKWLERYNITPEYVKFGKYSFVDEEHLNDTDFNLSGAVRHKSECINEDLRITKFFESDLEQANGIRELVRDGVEVIHFATWITDNMKG